MLLGLCLMLGVCRLSVLESFLFLMYGSETMIWREEEMSSIRVIQMDNLRCLLGKENG